MASRTRISGTAILPPAATSAWPQIDLYLEVFTTSTILEKIEALLDFDDLKTLRYLEYLRLWELDVTLNTLLYGIRFKNLRTLNFDKEFDTGITLTVLRNNPSLDLIKCDEANVDMKEILALFPNFKYIIGDFGCGCCDE